MTRDAYGESFSDRQKRSSEAKSALLAKLRPKPTVTNPEAPSRATLKAEELVRVRKARGEAKVAKSEAAAAAVEAARLADEAASAAALDAKRGERKERKALTKAEAKAKRDARYAARQARR
ncbi:MAG: hypothetical protein JSR86_22260 [Proteobacteria bacterium]|nr:hypothetical protein [Pseudomonadota bacterium]